MYKAAVFLMIAGMLLQACVESTVRQPKLADVTSSPSGATVYANGKKLGTTPLNYDLYEVFPAGWANSSYQAQGELQVKMSGCDTFTLSVSDYILSKPVHAEMKCNEIEQQAILPVKNKALSGGIEKRLKELSVLHEKGVITKNEYETTRLRILSEL